MTVYRSKIDWWLMPLVFGPFVFGIIQGIRSAEYEILYIMLPILLIILFLFSQIKYTITERDLKINGGFYRVNVSINDIRSVSRTSNPLSAPALSLDRIEIKYGNNFHYLLISPKEREKFINQLIAINPNIDIKI